MKHLFLDLLSHENAYVSEVQKFSFIEALNADKYEWEIIATKNDSSIFSSPVVKYQKNLNKEEPEKIKEKNQTDLNEDNK